MTNKSCGNDPFNGINMLETWQINLLAIMNILAMISNLIFNGSVIYFLVSTKRLKNTSMRLLLYLSISDCINATNPQILLALLLQKYAKSSLCVLETAANFFFMFLIHSSGYIICLICLDRYIRVKYLTRYTFIVTIKKEIIFLILVLLTSIFSGFQFLFPSYSDILEKITFFIDVLCLLLFIIGCLGTMLAMRNHRRATSNKNILKQINASLNSIITKILVAESITYTTYLIIHITYISLFGNAFQNTKNKLVFFSLMSFVIIYWNASVNALLFICSNKKNRLRFHHTQETKKQNDNENVTQIMTSHTL